MANRRVDQLPEKAVIGNSDYLLIIDNEDEGKTKKTTNLALQKKNLARMVAMNILLGI